MIISDWKRFTRRDRCPVCNGIRYDCRQNLSSKLIHCRADAKPSDYIYRGQDTYGFGMWAYKPDAEKWSSEKYKEWQESEKARKEAEKERHQRSLSDRQRDREVRKIFNQLYLSDADRAILEKRKYLSKEFILNCVSVQQWQALRESVNPGLPGVNAYGNKLNNPIDGILIPIVNHLGYWVGMRLYNPQHEENGVGKYTYLSSAKRGVSPHNQRGEHYLAVHIPDGAAPVIGFCEGLEFKPAIAAARLGITIIGASGGNFASSPETLKEAIAHIEGKLGQCELILFPDGGSRVNVNVYSQYEKLHNLIGLHSIADWGQWGDKAGGDIDEIDNLAEIDYSSPDEFFKTDQNKPEGETTSVIDGAYSDYINELEEEEKSQEAYYRYLREQEEKNKAEQLTNTIKRFFSKNKKTLPKPKKEKNRFYYYQKGIGLPSLETWHQMGRPTIIYNRGEREEVWLEALRNGYRFTLDNSFMGSGKSHAIPNLKSKLWQLFEPIEKLWYISKEHRNPSIQAIKDDFYDLMPRNEHGFKRDSNGKLIKADKDDNDIEIDGNCIRAGLFHKLQDLGYSPNSKEEQENPICSSCPIGSGACQSLDGKYRFERKKAFKSKSLRSDIQSLAREDYCYALDILAIEEAAQQLNPIKKVETTYKDLLVEVDRLRPILNPIAYAYLDQVIQSIKPLFENKKQDRYGVTTGEILKQMPDFPYMEELIEALERSSIDLYEIFKAPDKVDGALKVDPQFFAQLLQLLVFQPENLKSLAWLNKFQEFPFGEIADFLGEIKKGNIIESLSRKEKRQFKNVLDYANAQLRKEAYIDTFKELNSLPPNGLIWLLKAINGNGGISLRINWKILNITIENRWYSWIFKSTRGNIFLDATLDRPGLAYLAGIDEGDILEVRERIEKPLKNLTIHSIHTPGLKTSTWDEKAVGRVKAVLGSIGKDVPVICLKKYREELEATGHWFVDNRGSNAYQGSDALAFVGIPCPNKGQVQDEYMAVTGSLDGFDTYYQSLIESEILQGIGGRQRCSRYPEKNFDVFLLADLTPTRDGSEIDLSFLTRRGATLINEQAIDYDPTAGTKHQVFKHNLLMAAKDLLTRGEKVTQKGLATLTGRKQPWISSVLKEAGLSLSELIKLARKNIVFSINSSNRKNNTFWADPQYRQWMKLEPLELIEEAVSYICDSGGWAAYRDHILNSGIYPPSIRQKIIGWLISFLLSNNPDVWSDDGVIT